MASERLVVCSPPSPTTPTKFIFAAQLFPQPLLSKGQPTNQLRRLRACLMAKHPNRGKVSRPASHARGSNDAFKDQFYWKMQRKADHHTIQRQVSFVRPAPRASRIRIGQIQHRPRLKPRPRAKKPNPCSGPPQTAARTPALVGLRRHCLAPYRRASPTASAPPEPSRSTPKKGMLLRQRNWWGSRGGG
ncbi:hypothetical protein BC567DRAFT_96861 [Phyllosticta citribraziliensis]